jgi:hypothetical protein
MSKRSTASSYLVDNVRAEHFDDNIIPDVDDIEVGVEDECDPLEEDEPLEDEVLEEDDATYDDNELTTGGGEGQIRFAAFKKRTDAKIRRVVPGSPLRSEPTDSD